MIRAFVKLVLVVTAAVVLAASMFAWFMAGLLGEL